jgi:hypothetical protein
MYSLEGVSMIDHLITLRSECERLFNAGIMNRSAECRLKECAQKLQNVDSVPVLQSIYKRAVDFFDAKEDCRVEAFLSFVTLLDSVITVLRPVERELNELADWQASDARGFHEMSYHEVQRVSHILVNNGSGRIRAIEEALVLGVFFDRRLLPFVVHSINTSQKKMASLIFEKVLPIYGQAGILCLMDSLLYDGSKKDLEKLTYILRYGDEPHLKILRERVTGEDILDTN